MSCHLRKEDTDTGVKENTKGFKGKEDTKTLTRMQGAWLTEIQVFLSMPHGRGPFRYRMIIGLTVTKFAREGLQSW